MFKINFKNSHEAKLYHVYLHTCNKTIKIFMEGLPWWSSGWVSVIPWQRAEVGSLLREKIPQASQPKNKFRKKIHMERVVASRNGGRGAGLGEGSCGYYPIFPLKRGRERVRKWMCSTANVPKCSHLLNTFICLIHSTNISWVPEAGAGGRGRRRRRERRG